MTSLATELAQLVAQYRARGLPVDLYTLDRLLERHHLAHVDEHCRPDLERLP